MLIQLYGLLNQITPGHDGWFDYSHSHLMSHGQVFHLYQVPAANQELLFNKTKQNKTLVEENRSLLKNQGIRVVILLLALIRGFI